MKYRILDVYSYYCGLRYHTEYRYNYWPFWLTGPAFSSQEDAEEWIEWDKRNHHNGAEVMAIL